MKEKHEFFIRQTIKMTPKVRPSNNPNKIRLTFLERPYRYWKGLAPAKRSTYISLFLTFFIPLIMYRAINFLISRDFKARAEAELGDGVYEMREILNSLPKK